MKRNETDADLFKELLGLDDDLAGLDGAAFRDLMGDVIDANLHNQAGEGAHGEDAS